MKDINTTNEYIPNELIPEYFDKKYNLLEGIIQSMQNNSWLKLGREQFINSGTAYSEPKYPQCQTDYE